MLKSITCMASQTCFVAQALAGRVDRFANGMLSGRLDRRRLGKHASKEHEKCLTLQENITNRRRSSPCTSSRCLRMSAAGMIAGARCVETAGDERDTRYDSQGSSVLGTAKRCPCWKLRNPLEHPGNLTHPSCAWLLGGTQHLMEMTKYISSGSFFGASLGFPRNEEVSMTSSSFAGTAVRG